ncbi:MAG: hypothetical protein WD875_04790 [Pirellulales bacterium]
MTFVGKIFTVLIFVFSLVMMSLALMVGAAHKNWKDEATWPASQATAQRPAGLVDQLADAKRQNEALRLANEDYLRKIEGEKTAKRIEVAKLEAALQTLQQQHDALTKQHEGELAALGTATASLTAAEEALTAKQAELDKLRDEIRVAQADRDKTLLQVVDVADKNNQLALKVANLQRRGLELASQIAQQRAVLTAHNLTPDSDITGIAPKVEGIVKNVRNNGQDITVLVSVGSDDGLKVGHEMNVFRGENLIGRIRLVRVDPDRAVGESNPVFYKRPFQIGDAAQTFQPTASLDRQASNRK